MSNRRVELSGSQFRVSGLASFKFYLVLVLHLLDKLLLLLHNIW